MIDKTKLTKAVKDKYSFENETFKHVAKNNPKYRIEVEVGDSNHILQFAFFPELRLALENGRTLCVDCHRKTPTWGKITNDQYATN